MEARVEVRKLTPNLTIDPGLPRFVIAGEDAGNLDVYLATDLTGLADPVVEANTRPQGGRPGLKLVSTRFTERNIVFRVTILGGPDTIYAKESAWRSVWSYDSFTEIAYAVDGKTRVIRGRLEEYEVDTNYDLAVQGAVDVTMSVVADDPFWYDPTELQTFMPVPSSKRVERKPSGAHGPIFPTIRIAAGDAVPDPKSIQVHVYTQDGYTVTKLPVPDLIAGAAYTVNLDPGSRQWQSREDPNVWGRMNGVRYDLPSTEGATAMRVYVDLPRTASVNIAVPYLRPWR